MPILQLPGCSESFWVMRWWPAAALLLMLVAFPTNIHAWHAALGRRAVPIMHATTLRGDLEIPRAQDVLDEPCLMVTVSFEKLHLVCNSTCATALACDWNCQAAWNSFLRDAHSFEGIDCPGYAQFLKQSGLGGTLVPAPAGTVLSQQYLLSLVSSCMSACPQDPASLETFPCGATDGEGGSSFTTCNKARNPDEVCYPLAPSNAKCMGDHRTFNVTDGNLWYPFVTWGVVAHYKANHLGNSGGLYGTDVGYERNEFSSWACLWEESCSSMKDERKMACFRYSHIRGEFHFWKWSDTSVELTEELDVWTVDASFCHEVAENRVHRTIIDARDRTNQIDPSAVQYTFNRLHRDGKFRPAVSGVISDLGENGCDVFKLQRDLQYLLEINSTNYFTSVGYWTSPSKSEMKKQAAEKIFQIPIIVPVFPRQNLECSSLAFTLSWCGTSAIDMDLVFFMPNSDSVDKVFDPDTVHALMNEKRATGATGRRGPLQADSRISYSIQIEMDDDGSFYNDGVRTYGPETIYMFGDLPEGLYAVMAYVVTDSPQGKFTGGCESITLYSGMDGRQKQIASISVGEKARGGNWWHAFNIRVNKTIVNGQTLKSFAYGIINKMYDGPAVCNKFCGIAGDAATDKYQPMWEQQQEDEEWKMAGKPVDPRKELPESYVDNAEDGYKILFFYQPSSRKCLQASYIEVKALDALTNTYLTKAKFQMNEDPTLYETLQYRLKQHPTQGYVGGFMVPQGLHTFKVTCQGYDPQTIQVQVPRVCEGLNCLPGEIIYRELYMIPSDGKTRIVLNWGDLPEDLDVLVMPIGVLDLNGGVPAWLTGSGRDVQVYDPSNLEVSTTNYGVGREPYASWMLDEGGRCRCEYTCKEDSLHPFICTHYFGERERCLDYEKRVVSPRVPGTTNSRASEAPLCVDALGNVKQACCCNPPRDDGSVTCTDGTSDAWCCPSNQVAEIPGSMCTPTCSMQAGNTTISIDRDEIFHNMPAPDTSGKPVNRPEVASMRNLLPGMYKMYANAYGDDEVHFGQYTSVGIYLGNGQDQTKLVDEVIITRGTGKWLYAGYIMVTAKQASCRSSVKMLQKELVNGDHMCYTWFRAGYLVNSPLNLRYGAIRIRIAAASGRSNPLAPDFSGVQYSIHAGGTCSCSSSDGGTGCRCDGSALVHAGILGPTKKSDEIAQGWAITVDAIFFPVESLQHYWIILKERSYFDNVIFMGEIQPHILGSEVAKHSATMVRSVSEDELRIVFTWKAISDADVYIFKDPIPIHYAEPSEQRSDNVSRNDPFVFWDDAEGLPGIKLEQDCTTKECGVETVYFDASQVHIGAKYTVAVNIYAGLGQKSDDGKCAVSPSCNFQGRNDDETVTFYGAKGQITEIKYVRSGALVDWWLVAEFYRQGGDWIVKSRNERAYCTPNLQQLEIPALMSPGCVV